MSLLDQIIQNGNRSFDRDRIRDLRRNNIVHCTDGFTLSVIAGEGTYCTPRPDRYGFLGHVPGDYPGPYTHVEVGFPSAQPEPWDRWTEYAEDLGQPTDTSYAYVPVELVRELVAAHGGEAPAEAVGDPVSCPPDCASTVHDHPPERVPTGNPKPHSFDVTEVEL